MNKLPLLTAVALLAACASTPEAPPPDEPAPLMISESQPAPEPAPPPDRPPDTPPPPEPGKPQQTDTGRFRIAIASLDRAELTAKWVSKAEAAGYRTEVLAVEIDGKAWHRVLLPGYASLADAQAALPFAQQELGAPGAWVTSRRRAPVPTGSSPDAPAAAPPPPAPESPPLPAPEPPPTPN